MPNDTAGSIPPGTDKDGVFTYDTLKEMSDLDFKGDLQLPESVRERLHGTLNDERSSKELNARADGVKLGRNFIKSRDRRLEEADEKENAKRWEADAYHRAAEKGRRDVHELTMAQAQRENYERSHGMYVPLSVVTEITEATHPFIPDDSGKPKPGNLLPSGIMMLAKEAIRNHADYGYTGNDLAPRLRSLRDWFLEVGEGVITDPRRLESWLPEGVRPDLTPEEQEIFSNLSVYRGTADVGTDSYIPLVEANDKSLRLNRTEAIAVVYARTLSLLNRWVQEIDRAQVHVDFETPTTELSPRDTWVCDTLRGKLARMPITEGLQDQIMRQLQATLAEVQTKCSGVCPPQGMAPW